MKSILKKCTPDKIFFGLIFLFWSLGQFTRIELSEHIAIYWHDLIGMFWIVFKFSTSFNKIFSSLKSFFSTHRIFLLVLILPLINWIRFLFEPTALIVPVLYYIRVLMYLMIGFLVYFGLNTESINLKYIKQIFLVSSLTVVALGLGQYLFFPDMRFLAVLGWDDHYYRLIYPFFDPAFTGLILVLMFSIWQLSKIKMKELTHPISTLLVMSVALTFSRASYLVFILALVIFFIVKKINKTLIKQIIFWAVTFFVTIALALKPGGEGVNLMRNSTIEARINNIKSSTTKSDLITTFFGTGLFIHQEIGGTNQILSSIPTHNNQPDNYLIMFYSQLGILGVIILSFTLSKYAVFLRQNNQIGLCLIILVLVHGLFNASLTQPFVLLFLALTFPWVRYLNQKE